jgi:hypothetical protein
VWLPCGWIDTSKHEAEKLVIYQIPHEEKRMHLFAVLLQFARSGFDNSGADGDNGTFQA